MAGLAEAQAQLEGACLGFLAASTERERAEAEAALLAFRTIAHPLPLCLHVLQYTSVPYAQLHALTTLRESLGREWAVIAQEQRQALFQQLLHMLTHNHALEPFVYASLMQLLAVYAKHDAINGEAECAATQALLHQAAAFVEQSAATHGLTATQILLAMVNEFGAPAAGSSISWALHARARHAFQQHYLLSVFRLGLQQLERIAAAGGAAPSATALLPLSDSHLRWLQQCVALLTSVLSWDFDGLAEATSAHGKGDGDFRPGLDATTVRPPADQSGWRELIGTRGLIDCVVRIQAVEAHSQSSSEPYSGHGVRQLMVQLASVSRRMFDTDQASRRYVHKHDQGLFW